MKNAIILHGCPGSEERGIDPATRTYDKHWIPWTKEQLIANGIPTETPMMPEPWKPNYEKFKAEFEKYPVDENTILIGHSCGCAFLVRWLGESKQKISKLILIAPWKIPSGDDEARQKFYVYDIDDGVKDRVGEIIMFTSNDEEADGKKSVKIFHEALGGKIIELKNHGHYTMGDMGKEELPELIKEVI